jgi:hypothetical protein
MHSVGFDTSSKVADLIHNGTWCWPREWHVLFPLLNDMAVPTINSNADIYLWKCDGLLNNFSTNLAWNSIRTRVPEISWFKVVWYTQCIPKHSFFLWLVLGQKLQTQDKVWAWNIKNNNCMNLMCCLLCYSDMEYHNHLYFECAFSMRIWILIGNKLNRSDMPLIWADILAWISSIAASKSVSNMVCKLIIASSIYHIWRERNNRYHGRNARPHDVVFSTIVEDVRYRLMGMRFKRRNRVIETLADWGIHGPNVFDDGG